MTPVEDPIIAEFVVESREHLANVESQLMAIEAAGADIDVDLVNTVFRAVHSIKGATGFLGFSVLGELAHSMENMLNLVRNRELIPDSTNTDMMLRAADTLCAMIDDIHQSNDVDISSHVAELQQTADNGVAKDAEAKAEPAATAEAAPPADSAQPPQNKRGPAGPAAASTPADTSIRVSVRLLDNLMNLVGELVLSRNQLTKKVGSDDTTELDSVAARLDQITSELQEAVMQTRMQVVGTVFGKFPRVVRDLAKQLGKQCELTVEGEEVELDKSIIEGIGDPLTHLVRNSVDHGIESIEERIKAGKPAMGTVVLRAFHQAGKVNISISDDGAGINVAKLKEKAIACELLTPERAAEMDDREVLRLIFHAGFSMAKQVTGVSGRGVGMDVVRTNIEKLGGVVDIETEVGRGTTINIKLPLTLAIVPSLIVRCVDGRFAIPQTNIQELVRLGGNDVTARIERVGNSEVFRLRGKILSLVRLSGVLGVEQGSESRQESAANIIVVEAGPLQYGLIVDDLHGSEEIVVKPLGHHMRECHTMAGATILGDGHVALILDVTGIAKHCGLAS